MTSPLPPKKDVALALIERSSVFVYLDPRREGVVTPAGFKREPKLVLQVAKSGKTRQARKRYKVTREGIRRVQAMTNAAQSEGENNGN